MAHELNRLSVLRSDLRDVLGRLMTICYEYSPYNSPRWSGEADHWQDELNRAQAVIDELAGLAVEPLNEVRPDINVDQDVGQVTGGHVSGVTINVFSKDAKNE